MLLFMDTTGEARPVIVDDKGANSSGNNLMEAMKSRGYVQVNTTTIVTRKDLKMFMESCELNLYGQLRVANAKLRKYEES